MKWIPLIVVIVIFLYVALPKVKAMNPEEAVALLRKGALLIDVRTPGEFASQSVPGSTNYPLDQIEKMVAEAEINKDQPILLFCRSGRRSGIATSNLKSLGYEQVYNLGAFGNAMKTAQLASAGEAEKDS
ncbi:MAG: rhodanese-like domain-containing protein [Puniceicoccaceae bacterium]